MRVLYLHQYFVTRGGFTGTRSYEFARALLRAGHEVFMLCSGRHTVEPWAVPPGRDRVEMEVEGIRVVAVDAAFNNSIYGTNLGGARRMWQFLDFARKAARVGRRLPRPDVVYATSTPLPIGLAGMRLGRHFGVPFVFEVRDLWPEALINCGALTNPLAIWWLRRMERRIYGAAKYVVALSPSMKEGVVRAGVGADRVFVIPNGSDLDLFRPDLDGSLARRRWNLSDEFVAIYFGAMGRANGLEYVVEAARLLRDRGRHHIRIVLHGEGGQREYLESLVARLGLSNVIFSRPVPDKGRVAEMVAASNVGLTIYAGTDKEQSWSPNKMFDALAAGRPVLINVPGWLGDMVERNACGRFVRPDRPEMLADALEELAARPDLCVEMGRNARVLAEREFSREKLAAQFMEVLHKAAHGS